jgi:hypothetical protein
VINALRRFPMVRYSLERSETVRRHKPATL